MTNQKNNSRTTDPQSGPESLSDEQLDVSGGLYVYTPEVKKDGTSPETGNKKPGSKNSELELPY